MWRNRFSCLAVALGLFVVAAWFYYGGKRIHPDHDGTRPIASPPSSAAPAPRTAAEWYEHGRRMRDDAKDLRGAEEAYRRAIELEPVMAEAHFALGTVLLDLQSPVEAAAALESALTLAPPAAEWRKEAELALALAHVRMAPGER